MGDAVALDDGLTLRPAGPADTDGLVGLFRATFPDNPKADTATLRWQFWDNPYGRAVTWVVEDPAGQLVSHYAALAVPALLDGQRVTVGRAADAATLTAYRGRGLVGRAATAVFDESRTRGWPVTVSIPNPRSRGPLDRVGMRHVGRVRAYVAALDDAWLRARFPLPLRVAGALQRFAFRLPPPGAAERVPEVPAGLDELWRATARATPNGIVHDEAWWRWRYEARPTGDYRFHELRRDGALIGAGASVIREAYGGRFLHLLDVQARSATDARAVIGAAVEDARRDGAVGVAAIALPDAPVATLLRAAGLRPLPRVLEPHEQVLRIHPNDPARADLSGRAWTISWTDLDHL